MKYVSTETRSKNDLMLEYHSLVKIIAKKMAAKLPASIEFDDLVSAGLIGLMQSIERFDPEKGFKFKTYAEFRIRGAMVDELRSQDWCPKGMRQKAKQFQRVCEKIQEKKGRAASEQELCQALHLSKPKLEQLVRDVNTLEQMNLASYVRTSSDGEEKTQPIELVAAENDVNPFEEASRHDVRRKIDLALRHLPEGERNVLSLYYFEELNLKEIGERLHLSESRVCQLHARGISHLKRTFDHQLLAA